MYKHILKFNVLFFKVEIDFYPDLNNKNEKITSIITFIDFAAESNVEMICIILIFWFTKLF